MKDLAKAMEACEKFDEIKEEFISTLCTAMKSHGLEQMDTKEIGEVVDVIKDFAEAKKYCMEALYYQKVTEAMLSYDEPRYGYNNRRFDNGQYAPKRSGSYGYWDPHLGIVEDPVLMEEMQNKFYGNEADRVRYQNRNMMGYDGNRVGSNMTSSGRSRTGSNNMNQGYHGEIQWDPDYDPRYGQAYNAFCKNRKFYTATKSESEKKDMDKHAEEHVQDIVVSVKDIWKDADPTLKKHIKEQMTRLLGEMNV